MPASLPLALLMAPTMTQRLVRRIFAETPFADVHHLVWFDWAMLIPYFTVLIILSVYGLHRYETIRTYFKHRKKATREPSARLFEHLPPVTIQLVARERSAGRGSIQSAIRRRGLGR